MDLHELNSLDRPQYDVREGDECPGCEDGKLVRRYARHFEGTEFLGCNNYPRCEFTQEL